MTPQEFKDFMEVFEAIAEALKKQSEAIKLLVKLEELRCESNKSKK